MSESSNSEVAAEKVRGTNRGTRAHEQAGSNEPESMRFLVEKSITQTREFYERARNAFDAVIENWEKSFDAAGQGAVALNRKVIDLTQRNISSSFDLAASLSSAKNLAEVMELHAAHWRKQLDAIAGQAEEVRTLSAKVAATTAAPFATRMRQLNKANEDL